VCGLFIYALLFEDSCIDDGVVEKPDVAGRQRVAYLKADSLFSSYCYISYQLYCDCTIRDLIYRTWYI